uniref:Uncharacterized protein n=1 Tax=Tetranychus urticae TaxID=32264 RepID=T1KZR8_TETUR
MVSLGYIVYPLLLVLIIIHSTQSKPTDKLNKQVGPSSRQDYGGGADPLIPEEESESTEAPLPGIIGRAREGLQRFRENANDFWDGIRDRVSDWFDTD